MSEMSQYEAPELYGAAAEHMAQAAAFQGPDSGGYGHGDMTAGKGGDAALNGGGFAASEIEQYINDGVIRAPDDSVQTETGKFPLNINPSIAAMQDEPGDVGK